MDTTWVIVVLTYLTSPPDPPSSFMSMVCAHRHKPESFRLMGSILHDPPYPNPSNSSTIAYLGSCSILSVIASQACLQFSCLISGWGPLIQILRESRPSAFCSSKVYSPPLVARIWQCQCHNRIPMYPHVLST